MNKDTERLAGSAAFCRVGKTYDGDDLHEGKYMQTPSGHIWTVEFSRTLLLVWTSRERNSIFNPRNVIVTYRFFNHGFLRCQIFNHLEIV